MGNSAVEAIDSGCPPYLDGAVDDKGEEGTTVIIGPLSEAVTVVSSGAVIDWPAGRF